MTKKKEEKKELKPKKTKKSKKLKTAKDAKAFLDEIGFIPGEDSTRHHPQRDKVKRACALLAKDKK